MTPTELATWNEANRRAKAEYYRDPFAACLRLRRTSSLSAVVVTGTCSYAACSLPGWHQDGEWLFCTRHVDEHEALMAADSHKPEIRREQVAALLADGLDTRQIADRLGLSTYSIRVYRRQIGQGQGWQERSAACGTRTGKRRHKDLGEPVCDACQKADQQYYAERYRQRRKVPA